MTTQPIFFATPVESCPRLGRELGIDLRVKRDDLLPSPGGGNKVRKCAYIFRDLIPSNTNTVVTHGGTQSNHARVVAIEAARRGLGCELILHGESGVGPRGNLLLVRLLGAKVTMASHADLWKVVQNTMLRLESRGTRPFLIPGGAHCVEGARAYADAIDELAGQVGTEWLPDFIVHASGTGATQAGILAGVGRRQWPTVVVGISIGRIESKGKPIVEESYHELRRLLKSGGDAREVIFRDDWLCGGYERYDDTIVENIAHAAEREGLILDPTYTGKAFTALRQLACAGFFPRGAKVLFWHTGGLLNLTNTNTELLILGAPEPEATT